MHSASAATPVCLGEWSDTPETSEVLSRNGLSLFWKVFEEPREGALSKFFTLIFCSQVFSPHSQSLFLPSEKVQRGFNTARGNGP